MGLEIENEKNNEYTIKIDNEEQAHNLLNELVKDRKTINKFEITKPTDVLISIAILIVTILVIAKVTVKIYSNAILNYGTKMSLKDIIKVYKDKNNYANRGKGGLTPFSSNFLINPIWQTCYLKCRYSTGIRCYIILLIINIYIFIIQIKTI